MDTASFLRRVVPADGNYITVQWKTTQGKGFTKPKSFKLDQIDDAARVAKWASSHFKTDAYFAVAAYNLATTESDSRGKLTTSAKREQANVHLIKVLVADADVKRAGDGKDPARCFPDRRSAVQWLFDFKTKTGMPLPNLVVNSGHGMHFYWVLDTSLTLSAWQPMADAMKAAMLANGWPGDTSPTVDGARVLRPPGTLNYKVPTAPVKVEVLTKFTVGDYGHLSIVAVLSPWMGIIRQSSNTGTHGGATVTQIGARPAHIPIGKGAGLNQAAHAGFVATRKFAEIAKKCEQVKKSLAEGGLNDPYPLWYLGHITLAVFTLDGKDFIHPISDKDPRYNAANVDTAYVRAEQERATKGVGAPKCTTYDSARPGVCGTCPFNGKIVSPIALGDEDTDTDLPQGYRRGTVKGEAGVLRYAGSNDGTPEWEPLFIGAVSRPRLDELPTGGHRLTFIYTLAGRTHPVAACDFDMTNQISLGYFTKQGMSATRRTAPLIGDFIVAWIDKLRLENAAQNDVVRPFGWNFNAKGDRTGLAVAGTLYRVDGHEEAIPGGDPKVAAMYRPAGDFASWRQAAALFEGGRPDLQALIATSFGAPLISLASDVRGMTMNFWSAGSGVGKTSAMRVGVAAFGDPTTMQSMNDTPNAVMRSLSEPRVLVRYWDEMRVVKDTTDAFVQLIFTIPQGKERARMQADTTLREVGEWETMLVFNSNRSCQDYLLSRDDSTDAGVARLLEIELSNQIIPYDPLAGQTIKLCDTNYGHAGRIFIKHVAANLPGVQQQLADMLKMLHTKLGLKREERFLAAGMACTLVGARIAKALGLFNFDDKGIAVVLRDALNIQRGQRSGTVVLPTGGYNLEEIVSEYVNAMADFTIRTEVFAGAGVRTIATVGHPPHNKGLKCHIADTTGEVRLAQAPFVGWLNNVRRLPAMRIIDELKKQHGATEGRRVLGAATPWAGMRTTTIDIPMPGMFASGGTGASVLQPSPAAAIQQAAGSTPP